MSVTAAYAEAIHSIASAEGDLARVRSELVSFGSALDKNDQLRATLSNALIPADTRTRIVDDLLSGKASNVTRSIIGMVVSAGHGSEFGEIVNAFQTKAAQASGKRLALVRSAVPLSADQQSRLAAALASQAGGPVDIQTEIDPSVVGGVVTTMGDVVIDGTVRTRINRMKEAL